MAAAKPTVALDARFKSRSGGSAYVSGMLPELIKQGSDRYRFAVIRYAAQELPDLPSHIEQVEVPTPGSSRELVWMHARLPALLRHLQAQLYHGMKLMAPVTCPCAMVHTAHSTLGRGKADGFPLPLKRRLYFGVYGARMYRKSIALMAVSHFVADYLVKELAIPRSRITVALNGLAPQFIADDGDQPASQPSPPRPYILCVGNVAEVKNHRTALRAFAAMADELPHELLIAGDDATPLAAALRTLAHDLGLADRVRFLGFVEPERLLSLYREADILLHPSLTEGCSITVLEAMAAGLPVVASSRGALREVCDGAGATVDDPLDAAGFAAAIRRVLGDEALRQQMREAGRQRARVNTWAHAAERTLAVYGDYLRHRAPAKPQFHEFLIVQPAATSGASG